MKRSNDRSSVFQPFSSRGTSQKFLIIWRNLNAPYSTIYCIFREPSKELAEPLGSAEPKLKNTDFCINFTNSFYNLGDTIINLEVPICKIFKTAFELKYYHIFEVESIVQLLYLIPFVSNNVHQKKV